MSEVQLQYRDLQINVSADCEADLLWLQDFLGPSYRRDAAPSDRAACRVGLHADHRWRERRQNWELQEAAGNLSRVLVHVMDGTDLHLPCICQADGTLLAWDERRACFYHHRAAGVTWILQTDEIPRPRGARLALMRAVRELSLHHELRAGALALHASGLVEGGKAVLFAGPRRAGKTTLLNACLGLVPDLRLLANDRVIIRLHDQSWRCRGMATVISVRPGNKHLFPELHQRLLAQALGPEAGPGEARARDFLPEDRLFLSPGQFCRGLEICMAPESCLAAILLPRISAETRGFQCERILPEKAAAMLAEALFGATHPDSRSQLFDIQQTDPFPGQKQRMTTVQHLAETVPCFELVVGQGAYRREQLEPLLHTVLNT